MTFLLRAWAWVRGVPSGIWTALAVLAGVVAYLLKPKPPASGFSLDREREDDRNDDLEDDEKTRIATEREAKISHLQAKAAEARRAVEAERRADTEDKSTTGALNDIRRFLKNGH